ncbi:cytoplasmic polyadenylation element-binding protein-like [Anoplophora glabripennis]|uniref:cytoplasmic polyadenylation element-binding protein-like n=1 Tax=Anoplophora glabripennis TaxID=217634 RepID=UPI000C75DFA5|nr:cytoplasmic polyadenylation element-binding protein-like [Anoplophora glabripennis]XP_023311968.1 cytoplasmic polyadenylation element-binding protein-like [Anoplophora glabripennis]
MHFLYLYFLFTLLGEVAKTKWKGLRDTFRKEYQKTIKYKQSGAAGGEKSGSSWPYFESLYFLADQMTPRETSGNISLPRENSLLPVNEKSNNGLDAEPESPKTQNTDDNHTNDAIQVLQSTSTANQSKRPREDQNLLPETQQQEPLRKQQESSSKKQQTLPSKSAKRGNDVQKRMLALEEEKLNFFKQRKVETDIHKDYDYHFLMSLLPHFKNVKDERKLHVQLQLQQVLLNEITSYKSQPSGHVILPNRFSGVHASYSTSTTPQSEPSPASSTQSSWYDLSSPPLFSQPSVSQHSNSLNRNKPVPENEVPEEEHQDCREDYSIATYVTNFTV